MKAIYWDMDGTIANLYSVRDWQRRLDAHDPSPYKIAAPMHDMDKLNDIMKQFIKAGIVIGVISWLAMNSDKEYDKAVRKAKREWLDKYLPTAQEIHLVKYGTRKKSCAKIKDAILIDDNEDVRNSWRGISLDPTCEDFVNQLEKLLETV